MLLFIAAVLMALPLRAATLEEAMVQAYNGNPTLQKQRAISRAADEQISVAQGAARPSVDADAEAGVAYNNIAGRQGTTKPHGVGVTVTQPIYKGGAIQATISAAEKNALAERAKLQNAEQAMFLSVAQAFFDVARDQAVLRLSRKN
ncbi:MAG TPA: TolC family protein, partial [Alphaproteobacteria bacterium]|nr:TolC family protein [Alphaproteobacteria bacterium]